MKIAVMQPYLFPYIGYFQLIHSVDVFFVYGHVQYIKKGWFNRNRILLNGKARLFTFSLRNDDYKRQAIDRVYSQQFEAEKKWLLKTIKNTYRRAPNYEIAYVLIKEILEYKSNNLVEFNSNAIVKLCEFMGIDTKIRIHESIEEEKLERQKRVLKFCQYNGANCYINPIGGMQLYSKKYFFNNNVKLSFLKSELPPYNQFGENFIEGLSIIDVLMFNSKDKIKGLLNGYKLL